MTRDDVLRLVSQMQSLNFQPGERWSYSNTNYFLAGEIVSRASGMSLADFARKNIFEPLDMASTRFVNTYSEIVEKRAYGYRQRDGSDSFETRIPNYDLTGPTNLFTTVEDLLKWDQNFKSQIVGGPLALAALQKPGPKSEGYGLGLFVAADQDDEPRLIWHDGRTIGYRAHFFRHNHDRVSIALLCNVQFPDLLATDRLVYIISRVAQGRQPPPPIIEPRAPPPIREHTTGPALEEYCGTYNSSEIEATFELTTDGSSLVLDRQKYPRTILKRVGDDTFVADNNTLSDVLREVEFTFLRNGKGSISGFRLDWSHRIPLSRLMNFPFVKQK